MEEGLHGLCNYPYLYTHTFIDELCLTWPLLALRRLLSATRMYGLTMSSETNKFPIIAILSLILVETIFNRLSNVHLLGRYNTDKPQAFIILLLYGKSKKRQWCSDLFESSRNYIRTIKHRIMTVGEYT